MQPTVGIAIGKTNVHRWEPGKARQGRQPAHRHLSGAVRNVGALWAAGPITGHGNHNDIRLDLPQNLIAQAHLVHHTGSEILGHDVTDGDELFRNLQSLGLFEIQAKRSLALVVLVIVPAAVRTWLPVGKRREPASHTHSALALNTNDFSSQVGKLHGPERPSPHPGEVGDADSA
jgi:hypothetical protein